MRHNHTTKTTATPTYKSWHMMKQRCSNPNNKQYKDYGGRGILLCERWVDFSNFLADMGERPENMTLDRIDNNGNYEPSNCRWATRKQQQRNMRTNTIWTHNGISKCVTEWAEDLGCEPHTLFERVNKHKWPIARAVTEPPHFSGRRASISS